MWKKALLALAGLMAGLAAFVATRDGHYKVERSMTFKAKPDKVYALICDFQKFEQWSPWEKLDPAMKKEFSGTMGEVGAEYRWQGNNKVGEGKMTILAVEPQRRVDMSLEFIKPFASVCTTRYELKSEGDSTTMTWSMEGENKSFMEKLFGVLMSMEKMIGSDFERGLSNLKSRLESP